MEARIPRALPGPGAQPRRWSASMRWRILAISALIAVLTTVALRQLAGSGVANPIALPAGEAVVYAEFGTTSDTVYEPAFAGAAANRRKLVQIPHAAEFGIVAAAAPDGRSFAYTVLAPSTARPTPDSPAELWSRTSRRPRNPGVWAKA
jgi:hypothetical protein